MKMSFEVVPLVRPYSYVLLIQGSKAQRRVSITPNAVPCTVSNLAVWLSFPFLAVTRPLAIPFPKHRLCMEVA